MNNSWEKISMKLSFKKSQSMGRTPYCYSLVMTRYISAATKKDSVYKSIQLLIFQQYSYFPVPETISHLKLVVLKFTMQIWKPHWSFSVSTAITNLWLQQNKQWQLKNISFTRASRCWFFRNIQTFPCPILYLTCTCLDLNFQGSS